MKNYVALVRSYVRDGSEADLAAIGALKDFLIDTDAPIEAMVELHESALLAVKDLTTPDSFDDVVIKTSACLTELLIAYSFADHRKKDLRERENRLDRDRQRLEALGQMTGGVAHEFNNLLQPIMGMAELALEDAEAGSELASQLTVIRDCASQATSVVRGVLTTARSQSPTPQPMAFAPLLERTVRFLASIMPAALKLDLAVTCGAEAVLCEEGELAQVLLNLVRNASDAMNGAGTVRIALGTEGAEKHAAVPAGGSLLQLSIADAGEGMSAEIAARAFQPFFTTKAPDRGTGLGLAVVMSIVHGWNGTVAIETAPGEGTRVSIILPVVPFAL